MTFPQSFSLDGTWQLLPIDTFRQGFYPLEDNAWLEQELPAHWQQHPLLERYAGRVVYRRRFTLEAGSWRLETGESLVSSLQPLASRYWLRLNGIFYWSQPYFNGVDLGRHEGYFTPQEHEVTAWVEAENTLLVEVECPDEHNKFGKRMITGVFSHWDCLDPATNPGGIWLPVELIATGPTRIKQVRLETAVLGGATAELRFRATLDAAAQSDVTLRWTLAPKNFAGEVQVIEQRRALAEGSQVIVGTLDVRDPQPWWTHDMGHPNCYTITFEVIYDGQVSDAHAFTYGLRRFEMRKWIGYLNGKRLFLKGSNYAPGDTRIATVTPERCAQDLELAQACNMNMLRVHAHVEHPAFYEAADLAGVLLWQDFPLQWLYQRAIYDEAQRQARQMIELLGNHPSVALWCMHNEPLYTVDTAEEAFLIRIRVYFSVFVWNWNRDVLDTKLAEVARATDHTRPVVRSSGEYAVPFVREGTDTHFYYGWYLKVYGVLRSWDALIRRFPNNIRFVTEFGAQSFPNLESSVKFMDADISKINWQHLVERHHFQATLLDHWMDWRSAGSLEQLIRMTQDYQIAINRHYIDRLRYHKYRPTGGILPFMFNDSNPAIQWSIVDYWRVPKRSYAAMRLAFSPQYVFTLLDRDEYPTGQSIDLPIYIVNDAQHGVPANITAQLLDAAGGQIAQVSRTLTLPADCMALEIDRLRLTPTHAGVYRLALTWEVEGEQRAEQVYDIRVSAS